MFLTCPHCHEKIELSQSDQQKVLTELRDQAFDSEVNRRVGEFKAHIASEHQADIDRAVAQTRDVSSAEILKLNQQLSEAKLAVGSARGQVTNLEAQMKMQLQMSQKDTEMAVQQAVQAQKVSDDEEAQELRVQLAYYKDLKTRMSTKGVGESLEQFCWNEFNKIRAAAFPDAYFEKDNEVSKTTGSKGDFIFREDRGGVELLSIMFEMKNEMDTTAAKHHNEDFFKELDKDRREKHCEYAILVSMLEADNDLYNAGIVDVSYRYPKMYVVRPQFFISMITILRNAALNALESRMELARYKQQNIDVMAFEESLNAYKDSVSYNQEQIGKQASTAIENIDKAIDWLEKAKKAIQSTQRNADVLARKSEDMTIRKLTKDSPSVRAQFEQCGVRV